MIILASYHSSFTYNGENSAKDRNLIIAAFEPDDGLKDTFLSMESVQEDYWDGTKKFDYGARYDTTANISITVLKNDGSDFSLKETRSLLKWLTGSRINSWLNFYVDDKFQYAFLGRVTNAEQYKMDARVVGYTITFSSITPWAFSEEIPIEVDFGQKLFLTEDGVLYAGEENASILRIDDNGILYSGTENNDYFSYLNDNIIFIDNTETIEIDNQTDDLYTYINLDMKLTNDDCDYLSIKNLTLDEETVITGMSKNEVINLSAKQFIVSDIPNKIFGDDFNFVWPRLQPGINELSVSGGGAGNVKFSYRYPMKVGDCAMDTNVYGSGICCGDSNDPEEVFTGKIAWKNVTDKPTTIDGYGITDAYTETEIDEKLKNIGGGNGGVYIDEQELNNMLDEVFG